VEIATNNAQAEVAPLRVLAETLTQIKIEGGEGALEMYIRNMRVPLLEQAKRIVMLPVESRRQRSKGGTV